MAEHRRIHRRGESDCYRAAANYPAAVDKKDGSGLRRRFDNLIGFKQQLHILSAFVGPWVFSIENSGTATDIGLNIVIQYLYPAERVC
ncbi:hypothetical protein CSA57_13510 [candidate division KSB3 bacterium]|nr:MAG: hypothetical protein CSA57_13510 [candidate division KSB3 bacterium]